MIHLFLNFFSIFPPQYSKQ